MVFCCREVIFFMVFFHPGTSSSSSGSSKSLCSSRKKRQPKFIAAARGKRSQNHHFLWVSEVTLGIFGVQFWGFSVLQRHGVLLPGGDFFHGVFPSGGQQQQQQKPPQQQEEKVAKIHSSSKRQKEPKASFSMGFRTYVRHFRGAILGLLRPSEAWCFAAGRWFFPWCFSIWGLAAAAAKASAAAGGKGSQNS